MSNGTEVIHSDGDEINAIWVHSALDDAKLTSSEFRLYCHIKRRDGKRGPCWAAVATIAQVCRLDERTVRSAMASLIRQRLITKTDRPGYTSVIEILPPSRWKLDPTEKPKRVITPENATPPIRQDGGTGIRHHGYPSHSALDEGNPSEGNPSEGSPNPIGYAASQQDFKEMQGSNAGEKGREPNTKTASEARNQEPPRQFSQHPPPRIVPPETDEQIRHHVEGQQQADGAALMSAAVSRQRKTRKNPASTPPAPADPRFKGLITAFGEAFKDRFGTGYTFQGVKDAVAIKRLLTANPELTVDAIMGTVRFAWIGKDAWLRGQCSTIAGSVSQWNRLVQIKRPEAPNDRAF